jgi:C-terminal processing protease CtpA/Prc
MEVRMKISAWLAAGVLIALASPGLARTPPRSEAAQALEIAADRVEADYFDGKEAPRIAARLRAEAKAARRNPVSGEAFAESMTRLVRTLSGDQHFGFRYSPEPMPADIFAEKSAADLEAAAGRTARVNNFGILKAERLRGNVGLIDLDAFTAPERMRRPLAAAMELLRHCDALIVDLRWNGGGHARGAALAASYFLPQTPDRLLVRFETRKAGESLEIRTEGALEAPRFLDRPVYILTGPATFSAAEFFARVMQRSGRATVIGVKTRGGGHPSERIRLTPHFGMMLPTTRSSMGGGEKLVDASITPDLAVPAKDALIHAQRAALSALLAARPKDLLAENWAQALAALPSP